MPDRRARRRTLATLALLASGAGWAGTSSPQLGRPATSAEIDRMDITVGADGAGLPPGSGTATEGERLFKARCQACHGPAGQGGIADRLTGGGGTLASPKPVRTIASYWPYAPILFDYIRRAMPLTAPQSLTGEEVYGLVAYLLSVDHIIDKSERLDRRRLAKIVMPNRGGFVRLNGADFDGNLKHLR